MQLTHLRRADLNLLPALMILLEERQVSKAAQRFHLSQPAMSRVLARLRETFADELLIRTTKGYELTAKARRLHDELQGVLGELDRILRGDAFDPAKATNSFRIGCPDHASLAFAPVLAERLSRDAPQTSLEIVAWNEEAFADITRGQLDMVLWANEVPQPLESLVLHEDEMVCVMSAEHPLGNSKLTLERYVAYPHVHVTVKAERRHSIAQQLSSHGVRRRIGLRVPYFSAAVLAVVGTPLIATVPRWAVRSYEADPRLRIVPPPIALERPRYLIAWHPRMTADPAHKWFRTVMIESAAELTARVEGRRRLARSKCGSVLPALGSLQDDISSRYHGAGLQVGDLDSSNGPHCRRRHDFPGGSKRLPSLRKASWQSAEQGRRRVASLVCASNFSSTQAYGALAMDALGDSWVPVVAAEWGTHCVQTAATMSHCQSSPRSFNIEMPHRAVGTNIRSKAGWGGDGDVPARGRIRKSYDQYQICRLYLMACLG